MKYIMGLILLLVTSTVHAHEMVPTYPRWEPSVYDGVLKAELAIFNKRQDVEYYEIGIFDENWNPVPFVSSYKLINLRYLSHMNFDVYISRKDKDNAVYVCSKSKLRKDSSVRTAVSSKVCSKFK